MTAPLTTDASTARQAAPTGPSFAAALCGFVSTTVATTMLIVLIGAL